MRRYNIKEANIRMMVGDAMCSRAAVLKHDRYHRVPREIENFVQHINQELKDRAHAKPWTTNRAVTVFMHDGRHFVVSYESIYARPGEMLDLMQKYADVRIPRMYLTNVVPIK